MARGLTSAAPVLVLLFILACSSGSESSPTASPSPSPSVDTTVPIPDDKLDEMVLPLSDFPAEAQAFRASEDNGLLTLEEEASQSSDPDKQRAQLQSSGWSSAYDAHYSDPASGREPQGLFFVDSEIDVFATADGASAMLKEEKDELPGEIGRSSGHSTITDAQLFQVEIADEAAGANLTVTVQQSNGTFKTYKQIGVIFRKGRVTGTVVLATFAITNAAVASLDLQCEALARKFDERIAMVLSQLSPTST